jgi:hypothetical protein
MRTSPGEAQAWPIPDFRDDCARLTNLAGAPQTRPISIRRGMNFSDARGCCHSEVGKAALLSTNPTKAAIWEPARVEA